MRLVAGSYEKFIWGFSLKTPKNPKKPKQEHEPSHPQTLILTKLFSYPAHAAPIKCVAVSGPVAASGAGDDSIKLYDLSTSSEVGSLLHPSGAVTSLAFYTPSDLSFPRNLIAGSEDGAVSIYDADPFVHLKSVKAHRKAVADVAVHPSGRLALSVGRDGCLAMVNLVRGRRSFCCRLDREAGIVRYGLEGGERFFIGSEEKVGVHDAEDARLVVELEGKSRVLAIAPGKNGLLFTGGEDRCVTAWDTTSGKAAYSIENAHPSRIKGVVLGSKSANQNSDIPYLIASASSDGLVRVWDLRMAATEKPNPLAEFNSKSRLTCLAGS